MIFVVPAIFVVLTVVLAPLAYSAASALLRTVRRHHSERVLQAPPPSVPSSPLNA